MFTITWRKGIAPLFLLLSSLINASFTIPLKTPLLWFSTLSFPSSCSSQGTQRRQGCLCTCGEMMGLQKQMPGAHSSCIVCYLKATLWFVSRACFRSLELRYTRKVTRFLGVLENLEKYIFSMLTIFFSYYFHTSGFNPWKPAGTYFSNLFCKAFWIKWFRPKPYESIK